ncbi:hypothetical protein D3C73_1007030 [compost metagenome]
MSPLKDGRPSSTSAPVASIRVRPGKVAIALSTVQPPSAGRTSSWISRIVVSFKITAGSLRLARPGTCGMGMDAAISTNACSRRCADAAASRPVLPRIPCCPSLLTSICCPSAVSRNSGLLPVSSVASPVTT